MSLRGLARRVRARGQRALLRAIARTESIAYGADARQVLDVMRPRWRRAGPVVVVFHGGGWTTGSSESVVQRVCRRWLERGFVVANVEYRYGIVPANDDAVQALRWVQANLAHDPILTGESAGGQLALTAAFTATRPVRAVVDFYAPTDLASFAGARADRSLPADDPDATLRALSPLAHVRPGLCPVIAIHGSADPLVSVEHTEKLVAQLRDAGVAVTELIVPGGDHGFLPGELDLVYDRIFDRLG